VSANGTFFLPVVLGAVDDPGLFRQIGHSFLRKRSPDDIAGQVFHGGFFPGQEAGAAKDLKSGMLPGFQQVNVLGRDFTFGEQQGQDFG
jgi:hypothetical protein